MKKDKAKAHWERLQERKKRECERECAEYRELEKMMGSIGNMYRGFFDPPIIVMMPETADGEEKRL